jgi:trimeric autotransporter adhesin
VRRFRGAKFLAPLLTLAVLAGSLGLATSPARAAVANNTPDETWVANGDVHAVISSGGRIYLGGQFDQVGPNTGFGVSLNPATGTSVGAFPKVNGEVYVAVPDGSGGWYIGGDFTRVGTKSLHNAARILADGTVGGWNPSTDLPVRAIVLSRGSQGGNVAYIGGDFTNLRGSPGVPGVSAHGLAAVNLFSGTPTWGLTTPMAPTTPTRASVSALALSADGTRLYAGGSFTSIAGVTRSRLAAFDAATGALDATFNPAPDGAVGALALSPAGRLFVGGNFTHIAATSQARLAALSGSGAADPAWQPAAADGAVFTLTLSTDGSHLYAGGSFTALGGQSRKGLALLSTAGSGAVDPSFNPGANGEVSALGLTSDGNRLYAAGAFAGIGGTTRRYLAALDATIGSVDTAFDPRPGSPARAVAVSGSALFAGGEFTSVNGVARLNLAALNAATGALDAGFVADTDGVVNALAADGGGIFAGGLFKRVKGVSRTRLARVDGATGAVDAWRASAGAEVMSLTVSGGRLFVGGAFADIGGVARNRLASLTTGGATVEAWNPGVDASVQDMRLSPDRSRLYIVGSFTTVAGTPRQNLAAVDVTTGSATSFYPKPRAAIRQVAVSGDGARVFVAVTGDKLRGNRIQAYNASTGTLAWEQMADGDFQAVDVAGSTVYAGGHFTVVGGQPRLHLAEFDAATGALGPWGPPISGGSGHGVLDLVLTDNSILIAGQFRKVNGAVGQGVARFAATFDPVSSTTTTTPPATTPTTGPGSTPTTTITTPIGAGSQSAMSSSHSGYWMVGADGAVYPFGDAVSYGNATLPAGVAAVDLEPIPSGKGYWVVDRRGAVSSFGEAARLGSVDGAGLTAGEDVTSLSATPTGLGYWVFTTKGRVVPFGDAGSYGDMSAVRLNGPVLDSIPTPTGLGYYMVASDGGIFAFGDAQFHGSMGDRQLNAPVQSLVPDGDGVGYWLVASDGGIFAFEALFKGSMGSTRLNKPVTGMVRFGDGYLMVAEDGGIFNFSSQQFAGSLGNHPPTHPIVSVAALG